MKKFFCLSILLLLSACASTGGMDRAGTATGVNLNQRNYRVIKQAATGSDTGFWFLFFPIVSTSYSKAMQDLYSNVNVEGKAAALSNVAQDRSLLFLFIVSFPKVTITADVIEFLDKDQDSSGSKENGQP